MNSMKTKVPQLPTCMCGHSEFCQVCQEHLRSKGFSVYEETPQSPAPKALPTHVQALKDKLFRLAIEYARLKLFRASLESDGFWHTYCGEDPVRLAKHKLEEMGYLAEDIVRELSVLPGEAPTP